MHWKGALIAILSYGLAALVSAQSGGGSPPQGGGTDGDPQNPNNWQIHHHAGLLAADA